MKCSISAEEIAAFLDGELDAGHREEIEQHIDSCAVCGVLYRQQQAVKTALRGSFSHWVAPGSLRTRLHAAIEGLDDEDEPVESIVRVPSFSWRGFYPVAIAAAVMLILFAPGFSTSDIAPALFAGTKSFISSGTLQGGEMSPVTDDVSGPFREVVPDLSFNGFMYKKSTAFRFRGYRGKLMIYKRGGKCLALWLFDCAGDLCREVVGSYFSTESYLVHTDHTSRHVCPRTHKSVYLNLAIGELADRQTLFALVSTLSHRELLYMAQTLNHQQ